MSTASHRTEAEHETIIWAICALPLLLLSCVTEVSIFLPLLVALWFIWLVCGLWVWIKTLITVRPSTWQGWVAWFSAVPLTGAVAFLSIGPVTEGASRARLWIWFTAHRSACEEVVREVSANPPRKGVTRMTVRGTDCQVDQGPPLRIAFMIDGVVDNWYGVVYDPTGLVLKANELKDQANRNDPGLAGVRNLFGGELISCRHLTGSWYLCWFT